VELWAVQPPGRETRLQEPAFRHMEPLVEQVAEVLAPLLTKPFALFGYSMGALVSFEVARLLRRRGAPGPVRLLVAARAAPQVPHSQPPIHPWPDDAFVAEVCRRYNGIPQAVLREPELVELFLPLLRADCELIETYVYRPEAPLDCPISAFGGCDDGGVSPAMLEAWREQTRAEFRLRLLPGDHFFLNTARPSLLRVVVADLARAGGGGGGP